MIHWAKIMAKSSRSMVKIDLLDLARLARIARLDRQKFIARHPSRAALIPNILCVALCQGAALHFVNKKNGVKDFDVWTFYVDAGNQVFPPRRIVSRDFGDDKFGQSSDRPEFIGRRVDLLGRSIPAGRANNIIANLQAYLAQGRTQTARLLAAKAVVILEPSRLCGEIAWP